MPVWLDGMDSAGIRGRQGMVTTPYTRWHRQLPREVAWRFFLLAGFAASTWATTAVADEAAPVARLSAAARSGALVIAGGGELPPAIIDRFLDLGGGPEARLVVITT